MVTLGEYAIVFLSVNTLIPVFRRVFFFSAVVIKKVKFNNLDLNIVEAVKAPWPAIDDKVYY